MQFSLRRMLLAVAFFAATLGTLVLYARSFGTFLSINNATSWWIAVIAAAFGAGSLVLVGHRRDIGRIGKAIVWIFVGLFVGALLSANDPPELAIPGGAVGGIGCVLASWLDRLRTPPAKPQK